MSWVIWIYVKVPLMWQLLEFWRLFPGTPCLLQQDNARPHSVQVCTVWLHRHRVCVLDWPACSPDYITLHCRHLADTLIQSDVHRSTDHSPIENVWHIIERNQTMVTMDCWELTYKPIIRVHCKILTLITVWKPFSYSRANGERELV